MICEFRGFVEILKKCGGLSVTAKKKTKIYAQTPKDTAV
jgi:hypothetical protein